MNYLKTAGALLAISFASISSAQNYEFVGTDKSIETELCVGAGSDDTQALKQTLRKMNFKERRKSINTIICNNISPAKFAFKYGANNTFKYLNKRSYGDARVRSSVTISDVAKLKSNDKPVVIYVSTPK